MLAAIPILACAASRPTVSVVPFETVAFGATRTRVEFTAARIERSLLAALRSDPSVRFVPRDPSERTAPDGAIDGVQFFFFGTTQPLDDMVSLQWRLVDVSTSEVLVAETIRVARGGAPEAAERMLTAAHAALVRRPGGG